MKTRAFASTFTACNLNDRISFNLRPGQSRDHFSRVNCQNRLILHKNKQLDAKSLRKILNLEKNVQKITRPVMIYVQDIKRLAFNIEHSRVEINIVLQAKTRFEL